MTIEIPTVVVLMSTYNGEKNLEEQLKSIKNQQDVDVELYIRDDGSSDRTIDIAREYTTHISSGNNLGYTYSFLELINNAPKSKYYALADQDDIWKPNKLKAGVEQLEKVDSETPALYACYRQNLINGKIKDATEVKKYKHTPFNAYNNGYLLQGCTMVFNEALKNMLSSYKPVSLQTVHDVWIHQVTKAINGVIIYDERPYLLYRLDGSNAVGIPKHRYIARLREFQVREDDKSYAMSIASNLLAGYETYMDEESIEICRLLENYKKHKLSVLFNKKFYKSDVKHNVFLFMSFLLGSA